MRSADNEIQLNYIKKCRELITERSAEIGRALTYHVETFGCQMNERDSEKLRGILEECGYVRIEDEKADLVLYNTCTVRENANRKVYGRLGTLHGYKRKNPEMKICLCGCMMQEEDVVRTISEKYSFVDLIFGTFNIFKFAELLYTSLTSKGMITDIWNEAKPTVEDLPAKRTYSFKSGVNIMYGCNNFCSYCIVPYVRGRERSREADEIICEIERLADDGVIEIMLLGQNVNSYGKGLETPCTFPELLRKVCRVEKIKRVRFMTSHPKDLSDELIKAIAEEPKVCAHLHLPLQSGSSRVLAEMNRHYTKEQYLGLVDKIRKAVPDISLTTDIIVGFPGETEEDFEETLDVVRKVRFDSAFTFKYSVRTGTPAASSPDQIPADVVSRRFDRLLKLVQETAAEVCARYENKVMPVLVESVNRQDDSLVSGRLENNFVVHFPGSASLAGSIVNVRLDECKGFYYYGTEVI